MSEFKKAEFDPENAVSSSETKSYAATMPVEVKEKDKGGYYVTCPDTKVPRNREVKLRWKMKTKGWEIIGIHGLNYPVFVHKAKDGIDYKCKDKNSIEDDYEYTLIVGSTTSADVVILDPTIKNGGHD